MKKLFLFLISAVLLMTAVMAATISITPPIAYTNDDLTCAVDTNTGAYIYKWYLADDYTKQGQVLENSYTEPGQNWTCKVFLPPTPYTTEIYLGEVSRVISATPITPGNNPPTTPAIVLSLGPYTLHSVITATAASTDADGDPITYEYAFTRGTTVLSATNTLDCNGICVKGDSITFSARAHDGTDYSAWSTSTFTISNSNPYALTVTYAPATVYSNTAITASAIANDDDTGDILTYTYEFQNLNDSVILQSASANPSLTLNSSSENDTIRIVAVASDGTDVTAGSVDLFVNPLSAIPAIFTYCPINSTNTPVHIVEVTNQDSIEDHEYSPLDNFKVKVKVENTADESKDVYVKATIVYNNVEVEDTEVSEEARVGSDSTKTVELNMSVPMDLREGSYDLYIKVYDSDNRTNCEEEVISFDVKREDHDVIFKDVEFSPSNNISCGDLLILSGKLANLGTSDEEKVRITYEDDLKNKLEDTVNNLDWGIESRKIEFYPTIPKNATETKHTVTLTIYSDYNDGTYDKKSTATYYFTISGGCKVITAVPQSNITTNITTAGVAEEGISFSDFINNNWKSMLIIAEIVIVFLIVLKILLVNKML